MTILPENLAEDCFVDNLNRFGNSQTEPEKYNLYKGLQVMAQMVASLAHTSRSIETRLDSIERRLAGH